MRPYSTWAASSSPWTSLSRTAAQLASLDTVTLRPYFLYRPSSYAITTLAHSGSGTKPMVRSVFSGLSEPAAHAVDRRHDGVAPISAAPPTAAPTPFRNPRRDTPGLFLLRSSLTEISHCFVKIKGGYACMACFPCR